MIGRLVVFFLTPWRAECSSCGDWIFERWARASGWVWATISDGKAAYTCRDCRMNDRDLVW